MVLSLPASLLNSSQSIAPQGSRFASTFLLIDLLAEPFPVQDMAIARLKKFLVPASAIVETETAARAWELFRQQDCDQLVVLDGQGQPIGVLRLSRLLSDLPQRGISPLAPQEVSAPEFQQTLARLRQRISPEAKPLLEPLILLPLEQRIDQLQPFLAQPQQHWGMVDANRRFIGWVDRLQLFHFLLNQAAPASTEPESGQRLARSATLKESKRVAKWESASRIKTVEQQWQASGTSRQLALPTVPTSAKSPATPDPLIELLERLPIPLMLQTATGQVITQNLAWRQQVGELRDPQQVRREAALVLESAARSADGGSARRSDEPILVEPEASVENLPAIAPYSIGLPLNDLPSNRDWENWNAAASQIPSTADFSGLCYEGTTPDACVCLCPLKNGQERVWQFMKVSMGRAVEPLMATPLMASSPLWTEEASTDLLAAFKLATLSFHPDPNWYWLNQTEPLWLILAQDITEQQQVAKELAAKNADLVQLNRLKDEFLACISHELKTPLTAVLGLSSLLKDQALGALNDRQARYAQLIYQSGRHLIQIVNNILDLTRIETGQMDLRTEPVAIETVCRRAYEQACQLQMVDNHTDSALPHHPAVPFTLEIQPGLHHLVADELRLRQMLTNLLSNAIKFTPSDGEIGLRVEAWEGWIAFTIWDTGIGIPAEKQHLVFQKFQQLESPMTRRFEGTGLGLVLTQRLARLHGGDVTFTSQEGRGSEFTLLLPPSPPQIRSQFRATDLSQTENRLAIVIEADTLALDDLTHQLIGMGYRAAIARSGTEAIEKIRRLQPAVVFLNPILPLLSGWDVLRLLKADPETRHIPVIITALRVEKDLAYQNGADGFLSLPVQMMALQPCLDRLSKNSPAEVERSQPNLTVLYFNPGQGEHSAHLASRLHQQQCRVLEVEDLEQADLLARVWQPNVLLLDRDVTDLDDKLHQLSQSPSLANLPLITLSVEATEAANRIPTLPVFPCLSDAWDAAEAFPHCPLTDLLQVIRVAAGMTWTPQVLIVDFSQFNPDQGNFSPAQRPAFMHPDSLTRTIDLSSSHAEAESSRKPTKNGEATVSPVDLPKLPHRPQAIAQYLQIAGLQSAVALSWQEVLHQLQHHSANLLLFCVYGDEAPAYLPELANALAESLVQPPILVWHPPTGEMTASQHQQCVTLWQSIATEVLPDDLPISGLLDRIQQILCHPIE